MKKRLLSAFILIAYSAILIKVMVFKDLPVIRIGPLMLNFGGTQEGPANLVPFKTILPYLLGEKGLIIAGINLVGNIVLLVPIGFLVPFVFRNMTWKKSLALAVAAGFAIEGMQEVLHVGIFDIDDVILNGLGVMIGYWAFTILANRVRSRKSKNIIMLQSIIVIAAAAAFMLYAVYPKGQQPVISVLALRTISLIVLIMKKVEFPGASIPVMAPVAPDRSLVWEITPLLLNGVTASIKLLNLRIRQRSELQWVLHPNPI